MLTVTLESPIDWSPLFLSAGTWNIATGLLYVGLRPWIARRYGVGTGSGADASDRILVNLVHVYFGIVGFWIAQDPARDVHLIALWLLCKLTSVVLGSVRFAHTPAKDRKLVTLGPAATDAAWSIAFLVCLADLLQR